MASTLLSYTSSKDQLKWQGTKESLLTFLSSRLQVESSDIQVKDNGTCSVMKAKGMTFNFYIKAKTLQIQGKENANQLRADLVNLACTESSNDSVTPELVEQDGVEASRSSDEEGNEDNSTMAHQPPTINLDNPMLEGPYVSYFNTQIASIKDELKTIKSLLNFSSSPQTNVDTSESVINKLRQENDSLRRELIAEKERNNGLVEERESLKLVVKLLSKDLYYKSNNSTSLPKENENGNINVVHDTTSTRIDPNGTNSPSSLLSDSSDKTDNIADTTTVILGDSIIQNLQGYKLGKETGNRVVVKSFRGATTHDMKSYIQPTIDNSPERICLHVGTNDLKSKKPGEVADAIVDLARKIKSSCDAEVIISELTPRRDTYKDAAKEVNKRLNHYCKQNQWKIIRHTNISEKVLNRGGLHLTKQGNEVLHKNFVKCLTKNNN